MKTTKQVRTFIRSMITRNYFPSLYTNKVKDPSVRNVKIYLDELTAKQTELLVNFAGRENIRVTRGCGPYPGMIIKCAFV